MPSYMFIRNPLARQSDLGVSPRTAKAIGDGRHGLVGLAVVVSAAPPATSAAGDEREQIKWLTWATAMAVGIVASFLVLEALGGRVQWAEDWVTLVGILIPVAAGIAVLKYRLYGIDVVINKTVVFGTLAVFITAVYSVVVVGVGALFGQPRSSPALPIVATACVAFAFEPVRARAQRLANRIVYGERATPYEIMAAFSERVSDAFAADNVLDRMVAVIAQGVAARQASIWLHSDASLRTVAHWPEATRVRSHSVALAPTPISRRCPGGHRAFPVRHEGELLARRCPGRCPATTWIPRGRSCSPTSRSRPASVLRNVRLIAELRASRQRMVAAGDAERRRLERNLHDGAQQQLVALAINLRLAQDLVADDPEQARTMLELLRAEASDALTNLRDLARGIYPPLLADEGLVVALRSQAGKATVPVVVEAEQVDRYAQEVEAAVVFLLPRRTAEHREVRRREVGDHPPRRGRRPCQLRGGRRRSRVRPGHAEGLGSAEHGRPPRRARRHARHLVHTRCGHDPHRPDPRAGERFDLGPSAPRPTARGNAGRTDLSGTARC